MRGGWLGVIALVVALVMWIAAMIWCGSVKGAPAPRPKVMRQLEGADFIGEWALEWGGGKGTCQLARDGAYFEQWYGTAWQGKWELKEERGGGVFTCTEYPVQSDGNFGTPMTWSAKLKPGTREGVMGNGGLFRLSAPKREGKPDA